MVISCKCGKNSKKFKYLNNKSLPDGWDCSDECAERAAQNAAMAAEAQEDVNKDPSEMDGMVTEEKADGSLEVQMNDGEPAEVPKEAIVENPEESDEKEPEEQSLKEELSNLKKADLIDILVKDFEFEEANIKKLKNDVLVDMILEAQKEADADDESSES